MPSNRSSTKAQPEPTMRDRMTIIQRMHRRIDVIEEKWGIHNTPRRIDPRHVEQENPLHHEVSILSLSSSMPMYDESIYDDDISNMMNSLMTEHDDVFASFESVIDRVSSLSAEDLLEIIRSGTSNAKSSEDILSLKPGQDASNVKELLPSNSESNQSQLSAQSEETHKEPINTSTVIPEGLFVDLCATSVHNLLGSLILYPASVDEVIYDMVIGDFLSDLQRLQVHQFWGSYMKNKATSQGFCNYYPLEHAPRDVLRNFIVWVRVRKRKISADSLNSLRHIGDEIDVAFDEGDVFPTRGE